MPKSRKRNYTKVDGTNAQKAFRQRRLADSDMELLVLEANRRQMEKLHSNDPAKYEDTLGQVVQKEHHAKARKAELSKQVLPADQLDTAQSKALWIANRIVELETQHINAYDLVQNPDAHFDPEDKEREVAALEEQLDQLDAALDSTNELLAAQPPKVQRMVEEMSDRHQHEHAPVVQG